MLHLLQDPAVRTVIVGLSIFTLVVMGIWAIVDQCLATGDRRESAEIRRQLEGGKRGKQNAP